MRRRSLGKLNSNNIARAKFMLVFQICAKVHSLDQPAEFNIDARGKPALAAAEVLTARVLCTVNSVKSIPEGSNSVLTHLDTVFLLMALWGF
ncbi:hypothetical protein PoB_005469400 [Plakobranchus ocellatus]|uniref:Uncharacterized protein n=1 Tax=Plakobranchus ocellatus TaxID=259542 RepID=A0AAV4C6K1_9GAST|nr:hypothetical protein PoB_005469400 [Plakobranchus ocellatus]